MKTYKELTQLVSDIPANYHDDTFELLCRYIPQLPAGDFLEFGTGLARATVFIAHLNPDLKITTFDNAVPYNYPDYDAHIEKTLKDHGVDTSRVNHFIADSLVYEDPRMFVGMNIDSGHTYDLTYKELVKWGPRVKSGGFIINDDYGDTKVEVGPAIDKFLEDYGDGYEVVYKNMCMVLKKL